jgi:hypothetical protein
MKPGCLKVYNIVGKLQLECNKLEDRGEISNLSSLVQRILRNG